MVGGADVPLQESLFYGFARPLILKVLQKSSSQIHQRDLPDKLIGMDSARVPGIVGDLATDRYLIRGSKNGGSSRALDITPNGEKWLNNFIFSIRPHCDYFGYASDGVHGEKIRLSEGLITPLNWGRILCCLVEDGRELHVSEISRRSGVKLNPDSTIHGSLGSLVNRGLISGHRMRYKSLPLGSLAYTEFSERLGYILEDLGYHERELIG